ncbi:MAG: TOBE domain-containing protein, partial [Amylibacter sp.]|nr:TOBE domain-containing protein [Amylibacter sp.]
IAHVPEDRQREGLIMEFAAWENVAFGYHHDAAYRAGLLMNNAAIRADTEGKMARFDVRPPDPKLAAKNFSGGNQQKIVLAREIERNPDLLLIGQPTRGVDIGAIEFIHQQIIALRDKGKAVLLVSVELDEIMALSDRIAVMFDGRITQLASPQELYRRPINRQVADFIGVMNFLDMEIKSKLEACYSIEIAGLGKAMVPLDQAPAGTSSNTKAGIRPEMLTLLYDDQIAIENEVAASVIDAYYVGDMTYYEVMIEGIEKPVEISMRNTAGRAVLERGAATRVGWGNESILLL